MIYTKIALVSNQMKSVHKIFDLLTISNLTIFRRTWYTNFIILIFDMVSDMVKKYRCLHSLMVLMGGLMTVFILDDYISTYKTWTMCSVL